MASHWPHSRAMVRSVAWYASLKRVRSSRWRKYVGFGSMFAKRQFVDGELFVDSGRECFRFDFAAERKDQGNAALAPALANLVEAVLGRVPESFHTQSSVSRWRWKTSTGTLLLSWLPR